MIDVIGSFDEYQHRALRTAPRDMEAYPIALRRLQERLAADPSRFATDGSAERELQEVLLAYDRLVWCAGLAGEAGEFVDLVKKVHGHGHELTEELRQKAGKELGDVLWYLNALADSLGFTLSEVASMNIAKLDLRYKKKFTVEESKKRDQ